MDEFSVAAAVLGSTAVVIVTGDVDLASADRLRHAVEPQIQPRLEVSVDCSAVDFLDSAGLRVLLALDRKAREVGANLVLAAPSDAVSRTLKLAGVTERFTIRPA